MEKFPSDVFRDYNNLIDYRTEKQTGARFYRCYNPEWQCVRPVQNGLPIRDGYS